MRSLPTRLLPVLALLACNPRVELASTEYAPHPQVPSILRDAAMIDDDMAWVNPYVPGHRTTMDGRIGLRVQGGTEDVPLLSTHLSFHLFAPERAQEPILPGPAGVVIHDEGQRVDVEFPPALDPSVTRLGHHAICDPTQEFAEAGEQTNPYPCGADGLHDCYDIVVVSSTSPGLQARIWGTPATIEVSDPKTPAAAIVDVTLGTPVQGALIPASTEWTEPAVTIDGRLMTGRLGRGPRTWTNPETGETLSRPYDLAYSVIPEDQPPCDVTAWTEFHPMSHAPYDPDMVGRYGLAAYPFRDTEGQPIPDGEDMGGTYPWVDREGANVFMTGVHGRLSEQDEDLWPRTCANEGCEQYEESIDFDRGFMVAGLWTHGKLVHLDGGINHIDWAVGVHPDTHWMVDLYRDEADQPVPVRFGGGRFIGAHRTDIDIFPGGYTHNANILDSLEHLANFWEPMKPVTPRDVVWIMSNGVGTDEIAFDDLLDPNALIVSNMQPSITQVYDEEGRSTSVPHQHNGQVREYIGVAPFSTYELQPEELTEIHLQNGATSLDWEVPAYGLVEAGTGRTEPVALGGIEGRGFWLSGDNRVTYAMPEQPELDDRPAYIGIFVDPRYPEDETRELLRFPDGTAVALSGSARVHYLREDRVLHTVELPATDGWVHLGWHLEPGHRAVTLVHDGFGLDRFESRKPVFGLSGGELVLGRSTEEPTGARAWVDNLVVTAHAVDVEVACNHAKGSLVAVEAEPFWEEVAGRYPEWAHAAVAEAAGASGTRFACVQDHSDDYAAHLGNLPEGTTSVRAAIHFPEGPLRAGAPRPDSSNNAFCLSCHTNSSAGGLSTAALSFDPDTPAEHDPRRQPLQPPRRVFGNIPAGWLPAGQGPGSPETAVQAPPEGLLIDEWVLPAAE